MSVAAANRTLKRDVEKALRRLHITGKFLGLKYLIYAVTETVLDPERTRLITKDLYLEIARKYKTTASRVERDMRWVIRICWKEAREELEEMAGLHLLKQPTNREFIDYIAFYIRNS